MRVSVVSTILFALLVGTPAIAKPSADEILETAGIKSGLVVHLGCGTGELTAELAANDNLVVQGLAADLENVRETRAHVKSLGLNQRVSADVFDGERLPYVDNLVNLLVVSTPFSVGEQEIRRVLCPGGVAITVGTGTGDVGADKLVEPWPAELDEWTHYLHDARGTAVSDDRKAGHSGGLRWTGGPFWARSHEHTASLQAMVSSAGRVFYVMDEGPVESIQLPPKFFLTARDAFNGTVLWKRPLRDWFNWLYPLKSGPGWMPRRLVAVGDKVYIAPGINQDLLCLDAATGEVIRTYDDTATTFELIVSQGVVFAAVDPDRAPVDYDQQHPNCWKERDRASNLWAWTPEEGTRVLKAIDAESGKVLWEHEAPLMPMTLAADDRMVCFGDGEDGDRVVALNRKTGDTLWATDVLRMKRIKTGYGGPRLVIHGDHVLYSPMKHIFAIDAEAGEVLWSVDNKPRSGHFSLEDFYVIDDRIWTLGRNNNGVFVTYSLEDGEQLEQYSNPIRSFYIHQRCHPGRATSRFLLPPMMGNMVYDRRKDTWTNNHWVRGGCIYGVMPSNGMVYATPHACACYYQSKLNGFNALAPEPRTAVAPPADQRLVQGPAYGKSPNGDAQPASDQWPTFRHDNSRSGYAGTTVPADLETSWKKKFATKVSQPVVADGKLLLSAVDKHTVHALDASSGEELWHFIAGGRVNSPPTLYRGLAIFGCADGRIYALNAADGKLAWQFQAAPNHGKLMAYGQLESVWPLAGSVLIQDDKLYCVAGRSMFLDGGLRMLILKPETGELISENVMDRQVPESQQKLDDLLMGKHMPVAMPDILSGDGEYVYMKSQTFTPDGKRVRIRPQRPDTQYDREVHLFSPVSFLDDSWHQRTYWIYGRAAGEGWAEFQLPPKRVPCGRIMCIDESNAYGYGRNPELMCNTSISEYRLYSAAKTPSRKVGIKRLEGKWIEGKYPADNGLAPHTVNWKQLAQQPREKLDANDYKWIEEEPEIMAKAMVLTKDCLFVAGPRDVVDEKAMWGRSQEDRFQEKMTEQAAWLRGENGSVMQVFSKTGGQKLAEHELECLPAFDGLIAADRSLYLVTEDGTLVCLRGK
ncbi:MAG: PQQ-binding-like beta-propeller repeat protein [Planctomycetota bacterium]